MKVKVFQSCPTLHDPMDCTVPGILQTKILEWLPFPFSRESSQPRDQTQVSHIADDSLPAEPPGKPKNTRMGSVQFSSLTQSRLTLCNSMDCSMPSLPVHHQLLEPTQTHVHWISDGIQPSLPLSSPSPSTFNLSLIRVFSNESGLSIRGPKYWSFSFSITLSNEYSGMNSFRMDWLDLLAVQGTLKNLLQYHSSKASILPTFAFQSPMMKES